MLKIGDFEVEENKIIGIIGLNGSGKTTFLNSFGNAIKIPRFFDVKRALKDNFNHEYVKLLDLHNKKIKNLNNIEKEKLLFLLKIFKSDIVLLDEPFIDNDVKNKMIEIMKKSNKSVIITLNKLEEIDFLDYVFLMKDYKLIEYKEIKSVFVKIKGKEINKALFPLKNMKIDHFNSHEIEFVFNGELNELMKYIVNIKIEYVEIRKLKLEEIYKYYYKK